MEQVVGTERTVKIRAELEESTHKALRQEQSRRELDTGKRPHLASLVASILREWAIQQPNTGV